MWTLKCELRSIQDPSKWVWTLSQSELRSILVWTAPKTSFVIFPTLKQKHALFTPSKPHRLTANLPRHLRTFELPYDTQISWVPFYVTSFQKHRIYLVIWPVFVIDLAFNVATNLSKNRQLLGIGTVGDCWGLLGIGVPLIVVASAILIFVEVEFDSTSKTVDHWITTTWKPALSFVFYRKQLRCQLLAKLMVWTLN